MSNPKKIEYLDPATNLQDDDLLFASVREGGAIYVSKKVTLKDIADYVRSGMNVVPGESGYEMIDTSEEGNGIYGASTIQSYVSNSSKNYLWGLQVGRTGDVQSLQKTVSKDCLVVFHGDLSALEVQLNEVPLNMDCFTHNGNTGRFYIKAGQTLYVTNSSNNTYVSIIPLKSGGKFYFDTSHPERFYSGTIYQNTSINVETGRVTGNGEIFPGTEFNPNQPSAHKPTITVNWPTLFACTYCSNGNSPNVTSQPQINGKNIWSDDIQSGDSQFAAFICLDTEDTFTPILPTNVQIDWIAYPLLTNNSDGAMGHIDIDIEPIIIEDEPVSDTKASIGGAATCTANTSSNSTSLTLGITRKTPENASLQYAISTSKTPVPTSWTNASVTNNKLTRSISFTAETTQTKYLFIKVSGDGYEDSTYYVGIRQTYSTNTTSSTTYTTKQQVISASTQAKAVTEYNILVSSNSDWVNVSGLKPLPGDNNSWYFTYQVPNTTQTTTSTYGHSISEQLTFVS